MDRGRGSVDSKGVGDPPGRQTEVGAGEPVRSMYRVSVGGHKLVVAVSQSTNTPVSEPAIVSGARPACSISDVTCLSERAVVTAKVT